MIEFTEQVCARFEEVMVNADERKLFGFGEQFERFLRVQAAGEPYAGRSVGALLPAPGNGDLFRAPASSRSSAPRLSYA